jgi:hypothetical protein
MSNFLTSLVLLGLMWFWWDSLGAREIARDAGRKICAAQGLQFLDDSVALRRLGLQRNARGRLSWYREYRFEYSQAGHDRMGGLIRMLGRQVRDVDLGNREF